jgi:NAD(P)-dependent dehydrogenase (short-subunit alcohol dehydrogenase family)
LAKEKGQVVVIKDASCGIGRTIALALTAGGATPCPLGREPEAFCSIAEHVRERVPATPFYSADLGVDEQIEQLARQIKMNRYRLRHSGS